MITVSFQIKPVPLKLATLFDLSLAELNPFVFEEYKHVFFIFLFIWLCCIVKSYKQILLKFVSYSNLTAWTCKRVSDNKWFVFCKKHIYIYFIRNTYKLMKTFVNGTVIKYNYLCRTLSRGCNLVLMSIVKSNNNLHINHFDAMQNIPFPTTKKNIIEYFPAPSIFRWILHHYNL